MQILQRAARALAHLREHLFQGLPLARGQRRRFAAARRQHDTVDLGRTDVQVRRETGETVGQRAQPFGGQLPAVLAVQHLDHHRAEITVEPS